MTSGAFGTSPFISVGADPRGTSGADIDTGPFWPKIEMAQARESMRLNGTITEQRLREALIEAALTVIEALAEWKISQLAAGAKTLGDTDAEQIDGMSRNSHRWLRAVYCYAAASLAERYRGEDATGAGIKHALIIEDPIDDLRRDAYVAIADILRKPHMMVELF